MSEDEYIEKYKLNEWLIDIDIIESTINFRDKIVHKQGDQLHCDYEAAIIYKDGKTQNEYYLYGEKYHDVEKWKSLAIKISRSKKIKKFTE